MPRFEINTTVENSDNFSQKCEAIAKAIDPRLIIQRGLGGGEGKVRISGNFTTKKNQYPKLFVLLDKHEIASFPIDEVFTDQEIRGEIIAGLQKHNAKHSIHL